MYGHEQRANQAVNCGGLKDKFMCKSEVLELVADLEVKIMCISDVLKLWWQIRKSGLCVCQMVSASVTG